MKRSAIENSSLSKPSLADLIWAETKASKSPSDVVNYFDLIKCRNTLTTDLASLNGESPPKATKRNFELYRSFRDCLEPKPRSFLGSEIWRADLINYSGEWLPGGEPCRSIGHWNPSGQLEIFETLLGHVIMLVVSPSGDIELLRCFPGTSWIIPRGSFHLTYAPCPSFVINIYNTDGYSHDGDKYRRKTIPNVFLNVVNSEASVVSIKGFPHLSSSVDQYHCTACAPVFHNLRYLHSLGDIDFFNALKVT